ncbi:hypothetical protein D3C83_116770 [compost metagenome]
MQIAGPRVISQSAPQGQDLVFVRGSQAGNAGKAVDEPQEIGNHRRDLRLLQHDFRQPDAIGIGAFPAIL